MDPHKNLPSLEEIEAGLQKRQDRLERERLRDTFAAAALTGLIANGDYSVDATPLLAYRMADAMLRERLRNGAVEGCEAVQSGKPSGVVDAFATAAAAAMGCDSVVYANHDAAPAAKVTHSRDCSGGLSGTGNKTDPPCEETDAAPFGTRIFAITDAERQAIRTAAGGFGLWVSQNGLAEDESMRLALVTLRGLLERLK